MYYIENKLQIKMLFPPRNKCGQHFNIYIDEVAEMQENIVLSNFYAIN